MVFQKTCADCNFFWHGGKRCYNTLPRHIPHGLQHEIDEAIAGRISLCLGTSRTDCNCPSSLGMQKQAFFASAHPARIATGILPPLLRRHRLCLGTSRTDCNTRRTCWRGACWRALSRHIPHGLQRETEWRTSCSRIFASAHPARIATPPDALILIRPELCLGTSRTDCNRAFVSSAISAPSFASAHPARIATQRYVHSAARVRTLPRHIPHGLQRPGPPGCRTGPPLCLGTSRTDCNADAANAGKTDELCLGTSRTDCNQDGDQRAGAAAALCLGTSRTDCN